MAKRPRDVPEFGETLTTEDELIWRAMVRDTKNLVDENNDKSRHRAPCSFSDDLSAGWFTLLFVAMSPIIAVTVHPLIGIIVFVAGVAPLFCWLAQTP